MNSEAVYDWLWNIHSNLEESLGKEIGFLDAWKLSRVQSEIAEWKNYF